MSQGHSNFIKGYLTRGGGHSPCGFQGDASGKAACSGPTGGPTDLEDRSQDYKRSGCGLYLPSTTKANQGSLEKWPFPGLGQEIKAERKETRTR